MGEQNLRIERNQRQHGLRYSRVVLVAAFALLLAVAPGTATRAAEERIAIAVIVNPAAPQMRFGEVELRAIFDGGLRSWPDGKAITVLNMPLNTPVRTEFDRVVLKMSPEQAARHWLDKLIRGESTPPKQIPSADVLVRLVASHVGVISYVPEEAVRKDVRVVARIRQGAVRTP